MHSNSNCTCIINKILCWNSNSSSDGLNVSYIKARGKVSTKQNTKNKKALPKRGDIITFEQPSVTYIGEDKVDLSNPVAIYDKEPTNVFSKFAYYVLEWGKTSYIKRVIGLPGEHVQIMDGKVYINGAELDESAYLNSNVKTEAYGGMFTDIVVPEGYVFAMGDNRSVSADCRRFGCIPLEKIEGKVTIRFWPLNKFGTIKKAE